LQFRLPMSPLVLNSQFSILNFELWIRLSELSSLNSLKNFAIWHSDFIPCHSIPSLLLFIHSLESSHSYNFTLDIFESETTPTFTGSHTMYFGTRPGKGQDRRSVRTVGELESIYCLLDIGVQPWFMCE
jgi:hypothetical protein